MIPMITLNHAALEKVKYIAVTKTGSNKTIITRRALLLVIISLLIAVKMMVGRRNTEQAA